MNIKKSSKIVRKMKMEFDFDRLESRRDKRKSRRDLKKRNSKALRQYGKAIVNEILEAI